jgi:hypothetical protein
MRSRVIEAYKMTLKLTPEQRETLVGLLLGDACLETHNGGRTFRLKVEQSAQHRAYVQHLYGLFEPWVLTEPRERIRTASNGSETVSWSFSTVSHGAFRFYGQQFYDAGKKCVPKLIHRWLTARGLAYWFMDDGSMKSCQSKGVIFNTQGFERSEVERLADVLRTRFELQGWIRHQSDGEQIYVSGRSYERFVKLIDPYLITEMRYKVPPPRRTQLPKR